MPIPTPEWGDEPITKDQLRTLEEGIGRLTRDDVQQLIEHPYAQSYADGRVEVYAWERSQGVWIFAWAAASPAGIGGGGGDIDSGTSEHRLCLRFDENGILVDTKHIDSALGLTRSSLASLLDDWLGTAAAEGAAPGFAGLLDPDDFSMTPRPGGAVGIMIYADGEREPPCFEELGEHHVDGYRLYTLDDLRDAFFPWLEPRHWYERLPEIASGPELEDARRQSNLRFVVVVSSSDNRFSRELCSLDSPYTLSCYSISSEYESGRVALIDLEANPDAVAARSAEILRIPKFPTGRREACRWLVVYPARDIERVLGN